VALTLQEKKEIVSEVAAVAASAYSAVAAEYRGLTVAQLTTLRQNARKNGVYLRVVKNNLARIAVKGTAFECIQDGLVGPLVLAFSQEDPGSAARLIKDFKKDKAHDKMEVKFVAIDGKICFLLLNWIVWRNCQLAIRHWPPWLLSCVHRWINSLALLLHCVTKKLKPLALA
jgi:Ribosomal protein L10